VPAPRPDPDELEALGGRLLVAAPQLTDPNFTRTVVLLLEHGAAGAVGLVLNRPMHVEVAEILDQWAELAGRSAPGVMFSGGPVSPDAVIGLGRPDPVTAPAQWRGVVEEAAVVDLSVPPQEQPVPLDAVRLFSGYAGWGETQLEQELAENAWFVFDAMPGDVFATAPERLWHDVLQRQGGTLAMLASYPPSPSVN